MKERKIVIFGDSILKPMVLNEQNRYAVSDKVDWNGIEKALNVKIENCSKMGATIKHGAAYLSEYLKKDNDFFAAVIAYGGNDSDYNWRQVSEDDTAVHLPNTDLGAFEVTLWQMIELLKASEITPVLLTLPPISSIKYYRWIITRNNLNEENIMKHLGDIETIARHQELYNNIILKTAYQHNIRLVDVRKEFLNSPAYISLMCDDGIHPNEAGGKLIADTFIKRFS